MDCGPVAGGQAGAPGGQSTIRSACTPSCATASTRRVSRDDDDGVGAAGVAGGQRRVVASDFGRGAGRS